MVCAALLLVLWAALASSDQKPQNDWSKMLSRVSDKEKATKGHHNIKNERLETIPMFLNKNDCGKKVPVAMTQLAAKVYKVNQSLPGAGINVKDQKGYGTVMKDGFFEVACVKDYMYNHGDASGPGKYEYEIGDKSGVSVVHYAMLVPDEDQEPMSAEVCFNFCRTIPDMLFFGLTAGRECYCEPFYKPMAGDSSKCDAVCEGSPTTMCGGMDKSSVFEMHWCDSTAGDLADAADKAGGFLAEAKMMGDEAIADSDRLQAAAQAGQAAFGNAGDTVMSDLMQTAKVFAGDLLHSVEDAMSVGKELGSEVKAAHGLDGADFTKPENMKKAEDTMKNIEEKMPKVEEVVEKAKEVYELAVMKEVDGEPLKQYNSIMYLVDPDFQGMPSTCGGEVLDKPMVASSAAECAAACSAQGIACVGFSYVSLKDAKDKVCFMFKKFKSVTYYTECASLLQKPLSFLNKPTQAMHAAIQTGDSTQKKNKVGDDSKTMCYAKFASFTGMTLKPDPSGKCKACLKTADKAQRCFE